MQQIIQGGALMGVRILADNAQIVKHAAMYCSTSDWAFGPVFYDHNGKDAAERAEAFLRWLPNHSPKQEHIGAFGWRGDPRNLNDQGLEQAYSAWRAQEEAQFEREREAA